MPKCTIPSAIDIPSSTFSNFSMVQGSNVSTSVSNVPLLASATFPPLLWNSPYPQYPTSQQFSDTTPNVNTFNTTPVTPLVSTIPTVLPPNPPGTMMANQHVANNSHNSVFQIPNENILDPLPTIPPTLGSIEVQQYMPVEMSSLTQGNSHFSVPTSQMCSITTSQIDMVFDNPIPATQHPAQQHSVHPLTISSNVQLDSAATSSASTISGGTDSMEVHSTSPARQSLNETSTNENEDFTNDNDLLSDLVNEAIHSATSLSHSSFHQEPVPYRNESNVQCDEFDSDETDDESETKTTEDPSALCIQHLAEALSTSGSTSLAPLCGTSNPGGIPFSSNFMDALTMAHDSNPDAYNLFSEVDVQDDKGNKITTESILKIDDEEEEEEHMETISTPGAISLGIKSVKNAVSCLTQKKETRAIPATKKHNIAKRTSSTETKKISQSTKKKAIPKSVVEVKNDKDKVIYVGDASNVSSQKMSANLTQMKSRRNEEKGTIKKSLLVSSETFKKICELLSEEIADPKKM